MSVEVQGPPHLSLNEADKAAALANIVAKDKLIDTLFHEGKFDEVEPLLRDVLRIRQTTLTQPADDLDVLKTKSDLACLLNNQYRCDEAETLNREVLEAHKRIYGLDHPTTITDLNNLAQVYHHAGRFDEAIALQRQSVTLADKLYGPVPSEVSQQMSYLRLKGNLGCLLSKKMELEEAEVVSKEVLDKWKTLQAEVGQKDDAEGDRDFHHHVVGAMHNLAAVYALKGNPTEAVDMMRVVIKEEEKFPLDKACSLANMSQYLMELNQLEEAEKTIRESITITVTRVRPEDPRFKGGIERLKRILRKQGKDQEAESIDVKQFLVAKE